MLGVDATADAHAAARTGVFAGTHSGACRGAGAHTGLAELVTDADPAELVTHAVGAERRAGGGRCG
jgi:hypothetical protein